jgi:predicted flavoprotein YhiN
MAKHFGAPLKRVAVSCGGVSKRGETVITASGLEGGAIYALSHNIREALRLDPAAASLSIDLRPDMERDDLEQRLAQGAKKDSVSNLLRKAAALTPAAIGLMREAGPVPRAPGELAARIKQLPVPMRGTAGMERAISTAGGIKAEALTPQFMIHRLPGVFAAGEMLDFDAPTGGYLLQAAFATGHMAACGMTAWAAKHAS